MRSSLFTRYRKWLGASALAIAVGLGGGTAFLASSTPYATAQQAQLQPAAQISVPAVTTMPSFADLVEAVKPAVVSIVVESERSSPTIRGGGRQFEFNFPDLPESHPFRDFFEQFRQFGDQGDEGERSERGDRGERQGRPAPRRPMVAAGSGFIISADGYVVTNNHVVSDASKVTVVFEDGDQREAEIVGIDDRTDLAVLKIEGAEELPFVTLSDDEVRVGEWVVAVGNPFGLGGTVTAGIISARGRDIRGSAYGDFLQIDAAVNTGNSGGPAFNLEGEVVGVNTAIFSPNGGNVGIAFAIPAQVVKNVTTQLIENGTVTRGFLGVGIQDVPRDIASSVGLDRPRGALVTEPTEGGPAEKAGLRRGDVIISVDGREIRDALDLSRTIASRDPGTAVSITFVRGGEEQTIEVTLDRLEPGEPGPAEAVPTPEPTPEPEVETSSVGITVMPNPDGEGLVIEAIDPDSAAADENLQVGDVILEVDSTPVSTVAEFEAALDGVRQSGRNSALVVAERNGAPIFEGLSLE